MRRKHRVPHVKIKKVPVLVEYPEEEEEIIDLHSPIGMDDMDKYKNDDVDLANLRERILWVEGEVDPLTTTYITKYIIRFNQDDVGIPVEERKPITVCINTLGGEESTMWTLIQTIKLSKTPVHTVGMGVAESAGSHILAAGHKRYAMAGCVIMVHSGSLQLTGTAEQVESASAFLKCRAAEIVDQFSKDTHITKEMFADKGSKDWYMTAEEALKLGVIDEIITDFDDVFGASEEVADGETENKKDKS